MAVRCPLIFGFIKIGKTVFYDKKIKTDLIFSTNKVRFDYQHAFKNFSFIYFDHKYNLVRFGQNKGSRPYHSGLDAIAKGHIPIGNGWYTKSYREDP